MISHRLKTRSLIGIALGLLTVAALLVGEKQAGPSTLVFPRDRMSWSKGAGDSGLHSDGGRARPGKNPRVRQTTTSAHHLGIAKELAARGENAAATDHLDMALMKDRGNAEARKLRERLAIVEDNGARFNFHVGYQF